VDLPRYIRVANKTLGLLIKIVHYWWKTC